MNTKIINVEQSTTHARIALNNLISKISYSQLKTKFAPTELNIEHTFVQSTVLLLNFLCNELEKNNEYTFNKQFIRRLKSFKSFNSNKFNELIDKAITTALLSLEINEIDNIEEEISLGNKILDLKLSKKTKDNYVEISEITLNYFLEYLQTIGKKYFSLITQQTPIYFEVVFDRIHSKDELELVVKELLKAIKVFKFPFLKKIGKDCELFIDLLSNRKLLKQIPRDKLNQMDYLKSFTIYGSKNYNSTLAIKFNYKTVRSKMIEEIRHHDLQKHDNCIISLHLPDEMLEDLEKDKQIMNELVKELEKNTNIDKLLLFSLKKGSQLNISYILINS